MKKTRNLQFNSTNEISCMLRCDSFIGSIRHYLSFLVPLLFHVTVMDLEGDNGWDDLTLSVHYTITF